MAQAHEKLGQKEQAITLYRKAAATTAHNPPGIRPSLRHKKAGHAVAVVLSVGRGRSVLPRPR